MTDTCYTWRDYLEKLMNEGKCNKYLDMPVAQPKRNANVDLEPSTKTIKINDIFIVSEYLGATNNFKEKKI